MKKLYLIQAMVMMSVFLKGQELQVKLDQAMDQLLSDSTMRHASVSLLVVDALTGNTIYATGEHRGLAPASTQKIFTSIAAFELLGKQFTYKTPLLYEGQLTNGTLTGNIIIRGSGDPTLGSWRWEHTKDESIFKKISTGLRNKGIRKVEGKIKIETPSFPQETIPGGWIWDDIGNYYGAGTSGLNWRENQYDLLLQSGDAVGSAVKLLGSKPSYVIKRKFDNQLKAAVKGSGDNAYIYFPTGVNSPFLLQGTIPAGEKSFSISGASPDPATDFIQEWQLYFGNSFKNVQGKPHSVKNVPVLVLESPPFDSMNYWFMKKSINLYGEAFVKSLALQNKKEASTSNGVRVLKDFWSGAGIPESALQVMDGSGLSPQNRLTTRALVTALLYARDRPWFASFYHSLPVINQLRMKSGSISGARSYAGYHTRNNGASYIFAFIVNNYTGGSSKVVRKMWEVLDLMK